MAVVAIPVTTVSGSPALNVSTVVSRQGTPTPALIRATTCCAVIPGFCARARPADASVAAPAMTNALLDTPSPPVMRTSSVVHNTRNQPEYVPLTP